MGKQPQLEIEPRSDRFSLSCGRFLMLLLSVKGLGAWKDECMAYRGGGGGWWAVNLAWEIWRFNLAAKIYDAKSRGQVKSLLPPLRRKRI